MKGRGMRILVDENIPRMTVDALRLAGHEVLDIRGTPREGIADPDLWDIAQADRRLIITTDRGFALRRHRNPYGLLIVTLRQPNRRKIHERVMLAIRGLPQHEWGHTLVLMKDRTRVVWRPSGTGRS
jgi:predicted nuclease of predicted toxin-antitoxin system